MVRLISLSPLIFCAAVSESAKIAPDVRLFVRTGRLGERGGVGSTKSGDAEAPLRVGTAAQRKCALGHAGVPRRRRHEGRRRDADPQR